jgi:hypothetical protein
MLRTDDCKWLHPFVSLCGLLSKTVLSRKFPAAVGKDTVTVLMRHTSKFPYLELVNYFRYILHLDDPG